MSEELTTNTESVLRSLAPRLSSLERQLRQWLDARHHVPLSANDRARIESLAADTARRAEALEAERPLLVVMLMGGTGVGKSTLLNALAGSIIAQASFTRPTTRDPVVYYHQSVRPERFDPQLRHCRLVQHNREELAQKILVDTPDLDSNDLSNREKLEALLPLADIVLYVGSQEKYHDQIGWEVFKEQRQRRAFAFVLNKWDRCLQAGAAGLRPDEDLLRDLKAEGFENPLLFRTTAQPWLDHELAVASGQSEAATPPNLPEGEQFAELRTWLELGLNKLEIEAVKARGVDQLLTHLHESIDRVRPPDLRETAESVESEWRDRLHEEASVGADVLLTTLEPYRAEVEHHFSVQGQQRFRGFIAFWLRWMTKMRYASSNLRDRVPFAGKTTSQTRIDTPKAWNLAEFTRECSRVAGERVLDQRAPAMVNRLLVDADKHGFPLALLHQPTSDAGKLNWHDRYNRALMEGLAEVETNFTQPTGLRYWVKTGIVWLANSLPEMVFVGSCLLVLWRYTMVSDYRTEVLDLLMPLLLTLVTLLLVQVLIALLLPLRWNTIRDEFHRTLRDRLEAELVAVYGAIPGDTAAVLYQERQRADELLHQFEELQNWLSERQQATKVMGLYGA